MSKMMFEEFTRSVAGQIREFLPDKFADAEIELKPVTKNNDTTYWGLVIKAAGSSIAPNIYLEQFFKEYQDGEDMERILEKIAAFRIENEAPQNLDMDWIKDFNQCKDKIVPRIISLGLNKGLLEERPHMVIEDLAVTYYIVLDRFNDGTAGIAVTNNLMECWNVTVEDLNSIAVKNLPVMEKSELKSISEVLSGICGEDLTAMMLDDCGLYVLSNEHKMYGAAALMDVNMMAHIYEKFDGEFFMIPSSVHEWIVLPKSLGLMDGNSLASMIREVNATQVSPEERLSDHAYIYSIKDGLKSVE